MANTAFVVSVGVPSRKLRKKLLIFTLKLCVSFLGLPTFERLILWPNWQTNAQIKLKTTYKCKANYSSNEKMCSVSVLEGDFICLQRRRGMASYQVARQSGLAVPKGGEC